MDRIRGSHGDAMFRFVIKGKMIGDIVALGHGGISVFPPQEAHVFQAAEIFADGDLGYVQGLCQLGNCHSFLFVYDV